MIKINDDLCIPTPQRVALQRRILSIGIKEIKYFFDINSNMKYFISELFEQKFDKKLLEYFIKNKKLHTLLSIIDNNPQIINCLFLIEDYKFFISLFESNKLENFLKLKCLL